MPDTSSRCTGPLRRTSASPVYGSRTSPETASSKLPKSSRSSNSCNLRILSGVNVNREHLPAAHGGSEGEPGLLLVHAPFREPLQHLFQRDAAFEPRERCAEAEVDPEAEGEMSGRLASDVE